MSLLLKRRSRSETRPIENTEKAKQTDTEKPDRKLEKPTHATRNPHASEQNLNKLGLISSGLGMGRRKTSAELISEAKMFLGEGPGPAVPLLATGGARLVSTRRPITPRESGRVLYGKVALAGRPPSAFSMRYLQNEKPMTPRQLPALGGSGPATPMPTRNGALLCQSSTETLIELLKQHSGLKDCSDETVQHINGILQELYTRVRKQERGCKRGFILGGLYGLVECSSPRVLLAVARVVLALRVTGSNLTGACKLIFKVARNEQHDGLFHEHDVLELLIDGLGHASPLDEPEACIYAYGCIRFLTASSAQDRDDALNRNWISGDEKQPSVDNQPAALAVSKPAPVCPRKLTGQQTLVSRLARHGAVELMILHLQMLNEAGATKKLQGPPLHTLYQLSAAMRALADVSQQQQRLQLQLACPHLIRAAEVSMGELEVQANVVRTLSVLSEDTDCCETLHNYAARIGLLLGPSCAGGQCSERLLAVLSRLGYMLGNILAKHETARIQVGFQRILYRIRHIYIVSLQYFHNDVAMEYLLNVLEQLNERTSTSVSLLDAQIKLIRVLANMSVNPEVGAALGNVRSLGAVLLEILRKSSEALERKKTPEQQELLHATLGALHNLCFYQDKQPAVQPLAVGSLQSLIDDLSASLAKVLSSCPTSVTKVELARVLGNLTRNEQARRCFCGAGGLPLMVQQLTKQAAGQDYELRTCAIGVLVNLLGDGEQRGPFLQLRGAELLSLLLRGSLEQEDWFLANIVCQALWNLLIDGQCAATLCQNGSILDEVSDLLADYLDEDRLQSGDNDDDEDGPERDADLEENEREREPEADTEPDALWEDFALVATDLLERIQNNFDRHQVSHPSVPSHADNDDDKDVFIEEM
ncbi:hypothetical protein KR074_003735 [Drosophila pseudoananassae]|nr:hypothetical protein KR074_003735 [Drosophila pseudoananassae]